MNKAVLRGKEVSRNIKINTECMWHVLCVTKNIDETAVCGSCTYHLSFWITKEVITGSQSIGRSTSDCPRSAQHCSIVAICFRVIISNCLILQDAVHIYGIVQLRHSLAYDI